VNPAISLSSWPFVNDSIANLSNGLFSIKIHHFWTLSNILRFMENVAYDVFKGFPLPPPNDVWGEAKNAATGFYLTIWI
jgi:uncharacterized membrane protein YdjX (TVP38/TMEM64 family)